MMASIFSIDVKTLKKILQFKHKNATLIKKNIGKFDFQMAPMTMFRARQLSGNGRLSNFFFNQNDN